MRTKLIAANWKMNLALPGAVALARELVEKVGGVTGVDIAVAPNFTVLFAVGEIIKGTPIRLASQNIHFAEKGAFTGETSAEMLVAVGATHVIVGHSERRKIFGESDELINKKLVAALAAGLVPIFCVGETEGERKAGNAHEVVGRQLEMGLAEIDNDGIGRVVIAYEPVWAIGTGVTATPEQAQEMHAFIRDRIGAKYDKSVANSQRILYGGSVTPENVDALMAMPDLDGALVGGASLSAESFARIVRFEAGGR
jgi:triosephosphate isomerase